MTLNASRAGKLAERRVLTGALIVVAYGQPAPQGSKKYVGRGVMIESSKAVKPWREAVKYAALATIEAANPMTVVNPLTGVQSRALRLPDDWTGGGIEWSNGDVTPVARACLTLPLDGPLTVRMVFTLRKPASAPKRRRTWPDRTPDLSKLTRSTEDALVDAGVIADDARIVEYERLAKVFPGEDPEALDLPGVRIEIRQVGA